MNTINVGITSKQSSVAIIISRFNAFINKNLLSGAMDTLTRIGKIKKENIYNIYVPGSCEIPLAAKYLAKRKKHDAIITIGAIIQGNTDHFKYIANNTISEILKISTEYLIPITLGILTTENMQQAIERSGAKFGNKGSEAALAALEMINLIDTLKKMP